MFSRWFVGRKKYEELELRLGGVWIELQEAIEELDKYTRKRDAKGRFIKKENNHD